MLTEQLKLSLHLEQSLTRHVPSYSCPSHLDKAGLLPKQKPTILLTKKPVLGNLFLPPLYFKTYLHRLAHRQQTQLHFEMCAD